MKIMFVSKKMITPGSGKLILVLAVMLYFGCGKDDAPPPVAKSSAKQLTSFVFKAADNGALSADLSATIDENAKTIGATAPDGTDITALVPTVDVSQKATVTPKGAKDFTNTVNYTVIAEDGSTADYLATIVVQQAETNKPPGAFMLLKVANDSVDVVPAPTFSWEAATDPDGDMVTYDLYLDRQETPMNLVADGVSDTTFILPDSMALSLTRDYFWRVVAHDNKGGETLSDVFRFTVQPLNDAQQLTQTTAYAPRANHASVVFGEQMLVLGGLDQGTDLNDAWSSADGIEWNHVNEFAVQNYPARFFHEGVSFQDTIWVVGGLVGGSFSNDMYNSVNGVSWSEVELTKPFSERAEHTVTEHNGKLWVVAGNSADGILSDVWSSTDGAEWEQEVETAAFGAHKFHQTVSFKGKLWLIAGQDDNGDKNDVWSSTDGITWEEETPNAQFSPRGFHKALVFDDKIWVVGGGGLNDIWYSEDGVEWIDATPKNTFPLQGSFSALFFNNKIWVLGGTPEVWAIDYHTFK